jgi:NADH-quinone oxidoreductase subunit N
LIEDLAGLAQRAPAIAFAMMIFMLALTGIPPTAGFLGKLLILKATVVSSGYWWLGLAIVINSVISAFYYVNIMRVMYLLPPKKGLVLRPAFASPVVIGLCAAATLLIILQFGVLLDITDAPLSVFRP